jgi:hypothetical protein
LKGGSANGLAQPPTGDYGTGSSRELESADEALRWVHNGVFGKGFQCVDVGGASLKVLPGWVNRVAQQPTNTSILSGL